MTLFVGSSLYPLNKDLPLIGSRGQWKSSSESVGRCPKSIQVFQTTLWQELTFCESLLQSISVSLQIFFNDAKKSLQRNYLPTNHFQTIKDPFIFETCLFSIHAKCHSTYKFRLASTRQSYVVDG